MTSPNNEPYVPYEATAKIIALGEESNREFLLSLFPGATAEQIFKFEHFVAGKIHDGLEYGTALSGIDPISALEAYKMGFEHGKEEGAI